MRTVLLGCVGIASLGILVLACGSSGGGGGGPACGGTTCNAGEVCCGGCGESFCASGPSGCPGLYCPADATAADSTSDAPPDGGSACDGANCPCRSPGDCLPGDYCSAPEDPPCMGPCSPPLTCMSDAQCADAGAATVCRDGDHVGGCGPSTGPLFCLPPCTRDDQCHAWEQCNPSGHCVARPCSTCAPYLACTNGACGPKSCTTDANCSQGYCVKGFCYGSLGVCSPLCA